MFNKQNKTVFAVCGALIVCAAVGASIYAYRNPDSPLSLILFRLGIEVFEPSFSERKEGVQLLDGFASYESTEEVMRILQAKKLVGEPEQSSSAHTLLPEETVLVVKSYTDLGHSGILRLIFFNDRLRTTTFFPDQADSYFTALAKERNINFSKQGEATLFPFVRIRRGLSFPSRENAFVAWEDERLGREWVGYYCRRSRTPVAAPKLMNSEQR